MRPTLILLLILCLSVAADDELPPDVVVDYDIQIDSATWQIGQKLDTLDITVNAGVAVGGYNFKFATVYGALEIVEVIRGDIPDSCGWEFFSSRWQGEMEMGDQVLNYWTVVALPRLMADSTKPEPPCVSLGRRASLARIIVSADGTGYRSSNEAPIFFVWNDCGDNTISSVRGNRLFMADSTISWPLPLPSAPISRQFPSVNGSPENCISPKAADRIKRTISFTNGGIRFSDDF